MAFIDKYMGSDIFVFFIFWDYFIIVFGVVIIIYFIVLVICGVNQIILKIIDVVVEVGNGFMNLIYGRFDWVVFGFGFVVKQVFQFVYCLF